MQNQPSFYLDEGLSVGEHRSMLSVWLQSYPQRNQFQEFVKLRTELSRVFWNKCVFGSVSQQIHRHHLLTQHQISTPAYVTK